MSKKYNGDHTANARIKIEYPTNKKPKVTFSYPDLKNQYSGSMLPLICIVWFIFWSGLFFGYGIFIPDESAEATEDVDFSNKTQCLDYYITSNTEYCEKREGKDFWEREWIIFSAGKEGIIWLLLFIIPPALIYFPFRKRWNQLYPQTNALFERKKYMTFKSKDVQKLNGDYYCEVPLFKNVLFNYKATKDFSKYLSCFDIQEHKFYYKRRPTKKNKSRKKLNEKLWYARFYFREKPQEGEIEVEFH